MTERPFIPLPLVDVDTDDEHAALLRQIVERRGRNANFYRMVTNSLAVGRAITPLLWALWEDSELGRARIEIIILRVASVCGSEYEWTSHVPLARAAGVSDGQIDGIRNWRTCDEFDERDKLLLEVVDHAVEGYVLPDELSDRFTQHFTPAERIEILTTAGLYRAVAVMLKSFRVPLDPCSPIG